MAVYGQIPLAQEQPLNNNGILQPGATIGYYQPSTLVFKNTYQDQNLSILNPNPITLDGNGRAPVTYGNGAYRQIFKDPLGNVLWDQVVESPLPMADVSSAVLPLLGAETLQEFWDESYGPTALQTAIGGVNLLPGPTGPVGAQGNIGPTGPAGSTPNGYAPIVQGGNPGYLALPNVNGSTNQTFYFQFGSSATGTSGSASVSFPVAFPAGCIGVWINPNAKAWWGVCTGFNSSNFTVWTSSPLHGGGWDGGPVPFQWLAVGY